MDLLKIANRAQIHEFLRRFNRAIFTFHAVLKCGDLSGGWNFSNQRKISAQYLQNYAF